MSYYISIYLFSIIFSLLGGWLVFKRHRNVSGLFFLLFTAFASAWFFFYFLFFSGIQDEDLLLLFTRICFLLAITGVYNLLFFLYFFDTKPGKIVSKKLSVILGCYALLAIVYIFSDSIVSGLTYSPADGTYRELPGRLYLGHIALHMGFITLFIWTAIKQVRKQTLLNRIRLKRILFSAFLLAFSLIVFQLILPSLGIWVLEKEIIFLFVFFVLSVVYVVKRYYFSAFGYRIGHLTVLISSTAFAVGILNIIKGFYLQFGTNIHSYWIVHDGYSIIDTTLGILLFVLIYRLLSGFFLGKTAKLELKSALHRLEKNISYLTHVHNLEKYLKMEMGRIFKTQFSELRIFPSSDQESEIRRYFENNLTDKIFINDIVFIEEKKNKFNKEKFLAELPEEAFLVLPIFDTEGSTNTGIFIMGVKSFGDFYTIDEINLLRSFVSFLELHLKYLKTYELLQDLSVNLDKKVDEKTMEYNNLINKQKEFISIISHEIKSPIANAIFQADSILDDLDNEPYSKDALKQDLELLNGELIKTGELTTKLFSIQYFDTRSVTLFRERVRIGQLLQTEYEVYSRMHERIRFINEIDDTMGFVEIDKIQFQQVITNLLQNAVKFLDKIDSVIILSARKEGEALTVAVEDNGQGFQGIDVENLFDRYTTGNSESIGLGMGLYLCKKIIEMHGGTIAASIGERLGGAKFSISIPLD